MALRAEKIGLIRILLIGLLILGTATNVQAQTPTENWSIQIGSATFGLISFGDHTYLFYGFGSTVVPYSAQAVALTFLALLLLLAFAAGVVIMRSNRQETAKS